MRPKRPFDIDKKRYIRPARPSVKRIMQDYTDEQYKECIAEHYLHT